MSPTATPLTTTAMQGQSRRRRTTATGSSGAGRRTLAIVEKERLRTRPSKPQWPRPKRTRRRAMAKTPYLSRRTRRLPFLFAWASRRLLRMSNYTGRRRKLSAIAHRPREILRCGGLQLHLCQVLNRELTVLDRSSKPTLYSFATRTTGLLPLSSGSSSTTAASTSGRSGRSAPTLPPWPLSQLHLLHLLHLHLLPLPQPVV